MDEEEINIYDYIEVIWRRKRLAFLLYLIVSSLVVLFTLYQPPVYEAKTIILIEQKEGELSALFQSAGIIISSLNIQTQAELIKTRPVMERAADVAGMTKEDANSIKSGLSF